jgi:hypothetical protein
LLFWFLNLDLNLGLIAFTSVVGRGGCLLLGCDFYSPLFLNLFLPHLHKVRVPFVFIMIGFACHLLQAF